MTAGLAWGAQPYRAPHAMVVSGERNASETGARVLQAGGNAMDAAVAVGFALGVTHSGMTGLGGGGYILVRLADGSTDFFDFRERAPGKSSRAMFLDAKGNLSPDVVTGWRAAAVPGNVRGFELAHRKFGSRPWAELLQPAIKLAAKGHPLSYMRAQALRGVESLSKDPESKRIFLKNGSYNQPGDLLVQPELARTLQRIARLGAADFYEGESARLLAAEMTRHGGLITLADLKDYKVSERRPLTGRYKGLEVITASGSSSGGVGLLQMLGILEGSGYEKSGAGAAASIHFMAEAMRRCFADRADSFGDPDFFRVPYDRLLDRQYLASLRKSIDPDHATPSSRIRSGVLMSREGSDTTHFAVVDQAGNAVAVTVTLNSAFGSGVTVPGLGFVLNNNMDNFAANPGKTNHYGLVQGEANAIEPGKRPVSSMTPTIVVRDGKLLMVVGTPGGPTIVNSVLQALVNVVDFKMNAQDAVSAPRFHHQWYPDRLFLEPGFSPDTIALLRSRGHEIEFKGSNNDMMMILTEAGWLQGGVDPRREGKAAGY
ncbi:MAG TPA: gamma-glutamyltransferase [Bryobacteraceae bacterium]|nr:gamma-glutamyltransferase [Bryobacteraceae bacterium]